MFRKVNEFLEKLFTARIELIPTTLYLSYNPTIKQATIILGYKTIDTVDKDIIEAIEDIVKGIEGFVSFSVEGNSILIVINL